jgi:drug/metabolite transporter (DMT)-like permease
MESVSDPRSFDAAIPFSLIGAAELNLTASLAAILNSTTVLFAAVVAAAWAGEALTTRKVLGLASGIVGVVVLLGWTPIALNGVVLLSVGAMLVASFSYALAGTSIRARLYATHKRPGLIGKNVPVGQDTHSHHTETIDLDAA